uniref:Uncharacterized protein n=1 Tax=Callorhinchus milii TaxID=7868 RepID=A0A4W3JBS3_CALMI|eukprot:gi/632944251/ref/XP_007887408.1/ PREDICTED: uncharacterized protein C16orf46 homolog isoform X1 [Callorhinchus milii]
MESHNDDTSESENKAISIASGNNTDKETNAANYLHSWEFERNLIDLLNGITEETCEDQKHIDESIIYGGWEDATQGWGRAPPYSCIFPPKKTRKPKPTEPQGSHCVLCVDMVQVSESSAQGDDSPAECAELSSMSITESCSLTGKNTNSLPIESTLIRGLRSKIHTHNSRNSEKQIHEITREISARDNTETKVNGAGRTEFDINCTKSQQILINEPSQLEGLPLNTFPVLPPVIATAAETSSDYKPGDAPHNSVQSNNQQLQIINRATEGKEDSLHGRHLVSNVNNELVRRPQRPLGSFPFKISRTSLLHSKEHWCWQYSLSSGKPNLIKASGQTSKRMDNHCIRGYPSRGAKTNPKNLKQEDFSRSGSSHNNLNNKHLGRARQRNTGGEALLPVLPLPAPPYLLGTRMGISLLPHRLL